MDLRAALAGWAGWRRYGPAAGSAMAHVLVLIGVTATMAASKLGDPVPAPPEKPPLAVTLIADMAPPPPARAPEPQAAPSEAEPLPVAPPKRRDPRRAPEPAVPALPDSGAVASNKPVEIIPPARTGAPLGLKKLLEINPCSTRLERTRGDCDLRWAELAEQGTLIVSPTLDKLAEMYPDYRPEEPDLPFWMPRRPTTASSTGGGTIMAPQGIMPLIGGDSDVTSVTGRLPKANPDPAFDVDRPQWLDRN